MKRKKRRTGSSLNRIYFAITVKQEILCIKQGLHTDRCYPEVIFKHVTSISILAKAGQAKTVEVIKYKIKGFSYGH